MNIEGVAFVVMVSLIILTIAAIYIDIYLSLLLQSVPF